MYEESWWIEGRIRYTAFIGPSISQEMFAIDNWLVDCLNDSPTPIHFIIDVRRMTTTPSLDQGLKVRHLRHEKTGWVVVIGGKQNAVVRFLTSVTLKVFGTKFKDCDTLKEAADFLRQVDPALSEFPLQNS